MWSKGIRLFCFFLVLGIASCTTISPQTPTTTRLSWKNREHRLNQIQRWTLRGKIAVQTAQDAGSATINWIKNRNAYAVSLFGPLGSGGLKLRGKPGHVELTTAEGKHFTSTSAEKLLATQWGFNLPISHLNYWIRGLPVPNIPYQGQFDPSHRLTQFNQQGWTVQFQRYVFSGNIDLPSKLTITSSSLKAKIIIYQWDIPH